MKAPFICTDVRNWNELLFFIAIYISHYMIGGFFVFVSTMVN